MKWTVRTRNSIYEVSVNSDGSGTVTGPHSGQWISIYDEPKVGACLVIATASGMARTSNIVAVEAHTMASAS